MKTVQVKFKKIEVNEFDPLTGNVTYTLIVNDGADKAIRRTLLIKDPQETGLALVNEVKQKMKEIHGKGLDSDDPIGGFINILMPEDDETEERVVKFFSSVASKISSIKRASVARVDMKRQIEGMKIIFDGSSEELPPRKDMTPSNAVRMIGKTSQF